MRLLDDLCSLDERDEDTVADVFGDRRRYARAALMCTRSSW
jgi:hypothetical protein